MNEENRQAPLTPEELRQQLISRISECEDPQVLEKCMQLIISEEEGDEIVETMSVARQLRHSLSDKRSLIDHALAAEQEAAEEEQADETPDVPAKSRYPWRKLLWTTVAAAAVLIAVMAAVRLTRLNGDKEKPLVTVAKDYETIEVRGCRFNMVVVEGGTFTMGATAEQGEEFDSDEHPTQQVTLSTFRIGETEVTQGLWQAVMGYGPASPDGPNHPMKDVSWDECQQFIARLNKLTGRHFHLPTEAQWEFAARGGNKSMHYKYAGSNRLEDVGWYSANSWDMGKEHPDFGNHAVGALRPNELGLYDMAGNVWEWCQDYYEHYDGQPKRDPAGPASTTSSYRVNRGGSWDYIATSARLSNRRNRTPDFRNFNLGLRLAE